MAVELESMVCEQGEHALHLNTTEILPEAQDGAEEKNFRLAESPERSSQRSQCSPDVGAFDLQAMIEGAATDPRPAELVVAVGVVETTIGRCQENPALLGSAEFLRAVRVVRETSTGEWCRLRVALKEAKPSGVSLTEIDKATKPSGGSGEADSSVADQIVGMVLDMASLFHAPDGSAFAKVNDNGIEKTFNLDTLAFDNWLSYAFYKQTAEQRGGRGMAASDTAIRTAKTTLSGIAKHEGEEQPVYLRAAPWQDGYLIDLGGDDWRVVEVLPTGWQVLDVSPVPFWRPAPMRPLPVPVPGGDLARLWDFLNIPLKIRPLVLAVMLESWRPDTAFPILELIGVQGTGKSSTQDKYRRLIDPNAVNLRAVPKTVEDIFIGAGCNWLVSLNNLSHLSAQQQDALCNLATGGGFAGRKLYTNADENLIECKRPVVINGIVPLVTAQDLTDRVVHVELEPIPAYRDETEIEAEFAEAAPSLMGALLDLFVATLANLPEVKPEALPRMGSFAKLGEAMHQAQGHAPGGFIALYEENRTHSVARGLEASPVATAIRGMVDAHQGQGSIVFNGTMKKLLDSLVSHRYEGETWPKSARGLGDALRRQSPALSAVGIHIDIGKAGREGVPVTIKRELRERCEHRLEVFHAEEKNSDDVGRL